MLVGRSNYVEVTGLLEQMSFDSIPVHEIKPDWLIGSNVRLDILRLDQLHPQISGNKWFKLKHHLLKARSSGATTLLSFGGTWSNHIHALAAAGQELGFETVGVIRGERPLQPSAMLLDAENWGMRLHFVSRKDYRLKHDRGFQKQLLSALALEEKEVLMVPEGGSGELGVMGCEDILASGGIEPEKYHEIWLACGTGATMAGVIRSTEGKSMVRGVAVLKGGDFLHQEISQYLQPGQDNWQLELDGHCGGYGRSPVELVNFIEAVERDTGLPLDQVYVGKVLLYLQQKLNNGSSDQKRRLLVIHTGGLQGKRGLQVK